MIEHITESISMDEKNAPSPTQDSQWSEYEVEYSNIMSFVKIKDLSSFHQACTFQPAF
jgi:hypothetical protein